MFFYKKPKVIKKILKHKKKVTTAGYQSAMRGFQLNLSTNCNFKCEHCFTEARNNIDNRLLTLSDISNIAGQADELGIWELDIQGGEPLLLDDLEDIIHTVNPDNFYIYVTTNGWFMTEKKAQSLAKIGVDKISVSLDFFNEESNDSFRKKQGAYKRALKALENIKKAGMTPNINVTVGHYNTQSDDLLKMIEYAKNREYYMNFNMASPSGQWRYNYDIVATEYDTNYIMKLKDFHKYITRDLWAYYDSKAIILGCPAVNIFYINPSGDVLPCPYIPIKLGNILEEPLKKIIKKGWQVKHFRDYNSKCLSGEDINFIKRFLSKEASVVKPIKIQEIFTSGDLYDDDQTPF